MGMMIRNVCEDAESCALPEWFTPSDKDVICGWARQYQGHAGNERFRKLVQFSAPLYLAAKTKLEKTQVIASVVEKVRRDSGGGGFVKQDAKSGLWYEIGDDKARDKVGHAIRRYLDYKPHSKEHQVVTSRQQQGRSLGNITMMGGNDAANNSVAPLPSLDDFTDETVGEQEVQNRRRQQHHEDDHELEQSRRIAVIGGTPNESACLLPKAMFCTQPCNEGISQSGHHQFSVSNQGGASSPLLNTNNKQFSPNLRALRQDATNKQSSRGDDDDTNYVLPFGRSLRPLMEQTARGSSKEGNRVEGFPDWTKSRVVEGGVAQKSVVGRFNFCSTTKAEDFPPPRCDGGELVPSSMEHGRTAFCGFPSTSLGGVSDTKQLGSKMESTHFQLSRLSSNATRQPQSLVAGSILNNLEVMYHHDEQYHHLPTSLTSSFGVGGPGSNSSLVNSGVPRMQDEGRSSDNSIPCFGGSSLSMGNFPTVVQDTFSSTLCLPNQPQTGASSSRMGNRAGPCFANHGTMTDITGTWTSTSSTSLTNNCIRMGSTKLANAIPVNHDDDISVPLPSMPGMPSSVTSRAQIIESSMLLREIFLQHQQQQQQEQQQLHQQLLVQQQQQQKQQLQVQYQQQQDEVLTRLGLFRHDDQTGNVVQGSQEDSARVREYTLPLNGSFAKDGDDDDQGNALCILPSRCP